MPNSPKIRPSVRALPPCDIVAIFRQAWKFVSDAEFVQLPPHLGKITLAEMPDVIRRWHWLAFNRRKIFDRDCRECERKYGIKQ